VFHQAIKFDESKQLRNKSQLWKSDVLQPGLSVRVRAILQSKPCRGVASGRDCDALSELAGTQHDLSRGGAPGWI